MKEQDHEHSALGTLRTRAESALQAASAMHRIDHGNAILRELHLHEIELRMQNDELQQANEQAHLSNERFVDLFMSAPVAYFVLDQHSTILNANLAAAKLLGSEHARLHGSKLSGFVEPDQSEHFVRHMRATLASNEAQKTELNLRLSRGRSGAVCEVRIESSRDPRRANEWRAAVVDISDVRQLERELEHSRRLEAVGTFAAGVAHDFANLLGLISTGVDLVAELSGQPELAKPPLMRIQRAVGEGRRMVRQLLRFSSDRERADVQAFALDEAISGIEPELRRLSGKPIDLRFSLGARDALVCLDLGAPEEILLNLATNALNAMPNGGILSIETSVCDAPPSAKPPGRVVVLSVKDTGRGMDAETRGRAFEPFFTTRSKNSGTGLGLAMVHRIVSRAGGTVRLDSELGKGTTVVINLPLHPPETPTS